MACAQANSVVGTSQPAQFPVELRDTSPLGEHGLLLILIGIQDRGGQILANLPGERDEKRASPYLLRLETEPDAQTELGVVLEQRVAPCRAAPFGIYGPRSRR